MRPENHDAPQHGLLSRRFRRLAVDLIGKMPRPRAFDNPARSETQSMPAVSRVDPLLGEGGQQAADLSERVQDIDAPSKEGMMPSEP